LARASLAITHAGLNTVLEALNVGVPMVAIPVTNDQPAVASRVKCVGAGEVVPLTHLSSHRLRAAIDLVLGDENYRRRAQRLMEQIKTSGGAQRAAEIVEQQLAFRLPIYSSSDHDSRVFLELRQVSTLV
jgi:UDP:flavonoid glycosyltransferase YjiC (YdhE family)